MRTLALVLLLASGVLPTWAQGVAGDWLGTLKVGSAELRLLMHLTSSGDGKLKGTLDSIDQGANGIPIDSIELVGDKLHFTSAVINGSYQGTVNPDNNHIDGTWTQGQPLPLQFARQEKPIATERKPGKPSDIDGTWSGVLDTGVLQLHLVFHITNMEDGLAVTMDSPDQGAHGVPATRVERSGASLTIEMKQLAGEYKAAVTEDRTTLNGTWTQNGTSLPLVLKKSK